MPRKKTQEEFIEQLKISYRNKWDISKVEYIKSNKKIILGCNIHGWFNITPNNLLSGGGCPKCALKQKGINHRLTQKEFVKRSNEKHNKFFDYSKTIYKKGTEKVIITCPIHEDFEQLPNSHLQGKGCLKCSHDNASIKNRLTYGEFVIQAIKIHGNKFDYSKVNYINYNNVVTIGCSIHGFFEQRVADHLAGHGCQECGKESRAKINRKDLSTVLKDFYLIHGKLFGYQKVKYINTNTKVEIECKEHGYFWQKPANHLIGQGCPLCKGEKISNSKRRIPKDLQGLVTKIRDGIRQIIRNRKGLSKKSKTKDIIGCDYETLKTHLEDNPYGFKISDKGLNLDHIIPQAIIETIEDVHRLNHYTNFQLLPSYYNKHIKRDKDWDKKDFERWFKVYVNKFKYKNYSEILTKY